MRAAPSRPARLVSGEIVARRRLEQHAVARSGDRHSGPSCGKRNLQLETEFLSDATSVRWHAPAALQLPGVVDLWLG